MDLLVGIDKDIFRSLIFYNDRNGRRYVPLTLEDAMRLIMKGLREERIRLNFKIIAAIIPHLKNFDLTNPEIPDAIKFVVDYMKDSTKSHDSLLEYIGEDQLDNPSSLVRIVLERMEMSEELTLPFLKESISLLMDNFDVAYRRPVWKDEPTKIFQIVVPDFYPGSIVKIARYIKDKFNNTVSYVVDRTFYRKNTEILLAILLRLNNEVVLPEFMQGHILALRSFVSRKFEENTQKGSTIADYFYMIKNFESFRAPCMPKRILEAEGRLRPLLPNVLPWSFALPPGNPWQQTLKILINLKSQSIPKKVNFELDNFIYHVQSSGLLGKSNILYEDGIIFQRDDSLEVELDIYSLLLRIPNIFRDERYSPLISFLTKLNIVDYLGPRFNEFAYAKPRQLLLALLKTAFSTAAVQQEQKLRRALFVAQSYLEEPILINMYISRDLQNILKSLPAIENNPRLIPLKLLFREENLFKYMSPGFSLAGLKSPLEQVALILNTVNLKPVPQPLGESIKLALNAMEGHPLPWRSFMQEDFIYLVNELLSRNKKIKTYLLKATPYKKVSDWNLTSSGTPENILARALRYPVENISRDPKLARTINNAITILEGESRQDFELLTKKMLDSMLEYLPDSVDTRVVNLLLKKSNLAMINTTFNISSLNDLDPKTALINLLENLTKSKEIQTEELLIIKLKTALSSVKKFKKSSNHSVFDIYLKKVLTNPADKKYEALFEKLRKMNGTEVLPLERESMLRTYLIMIKDNSTTSELRNAAKSALRELSIERSNVSSVNLTLKNFNFFLRQLEKSSQVESNEEFIRQILMHVPNTITFNEIRQFVRSGRVFEFLPKGFNMEKHSLPQEKLVHVLETVQRGLQLGSSLYRSMRHLNRHLLDQLRVIQEIDVESLRNILNELSVNRDLIALKLFFNTDYLAKYLPRKFRLKNHKNPRRALVAILEIFVTVPSVRKRTELYNAILYVKLILNEELMKRNTRKLLLTKRLKEEEFNFVLALSVRSSYVKDLLSPRSLVRVLPVTFNFSGMKTFKAKTVHLLKALIKTQRSLRTDLRKLLEEVQSYPNILKIKDEELQPLISLIPDSGIPDLPLLKYNLKANKLASILPSNYIIKRNKTPKDNLQEILYFLNYTLDKSEVRLKKVVFAVWSELHKKNPKIFRVHVNISLDDVQSLLLEIPFHKHKDLEILKFLLNEHKILAILPQNFSLSQCKTKKSCLLTILETVMKRPEAKNVIQGLNKAKNIIHLMPDTPKINNTEIKNLFSMIIQNEKQLQHVLSSCQTKNLFLHLPINFNLQALSSRKKKILAIVYNCKQVKLNTFVVNKLLKKIEQTAKKLPDVDLTREDIENIINEIPYTSFSIIKILLVFLAKSNIIELLPWNLNLEIQATWKLKALTLIKTMKKIASFENEKMMAAMTDLEENIKKLPNEPRLTQQDLTSLRKLSVLQDIKAQDILKFLSLKYLLKVVPSTVNIQELTFDFTKLTIILHYINRLGPVMQKDINKSLKFVEHNLTKGAEQEALNFLKIQINQNENKFLPLKLHLMANNEKFFAFLSDISHGYEYQYIVARVRVILKRLLTSRDIQKSKSLVESMEALVFQLSTGPPADYDIQEALEELPISTKYLELRILLKSSNYKKLFGNIMLTQEHTPKRILLDMLKMVVKVEQDTDILQIIGNLIKEVQNSVWNFEFEEMFKELLNYAKHMSKLESIRSYWIHVGPEQILGKDYHTKYPKISDRLKILYERITVDQEVDGNKKLKESVNYLHVILKGGEVTDRTISLEKDINEINAKTLFVVLPKTRDEGIILGILKFFAIPNLMQKIKLSKNYSQYENKGSLMQAILKSGLSLDVVREDSRMRKSLEYFIDKIRFDGPGGRPIEFKKLIKDMQIDMIGLLKAVDPKAVNISMVVKMGRFFEDEYNDHIHGIGFDKTVHKSRGEYLKALLEHLIHHTDVPNDIKDCAKNIYQAVKLNGSGAERVDVNEEIIPDNRVFGNDFDEFETTEKSTNDLHTIFSHLQPESSTDLWDVLVPTDVHSSSTISHPIKKKSKKRKKNHESRNDMKSKNVNLKNNAVSENMTIDNNKVGTLSNITLKAQTQFRRSIRQVARNGSSRNRNYEESSINHDPESATFHPDEILFDPKDITDDPSLRIIPDVRKLITFKEAESLYKRKRGPVKPMRVRSNELPATVEEIKVVSHGTRKDQKVVDLETRMLFVRPITMDPYKKNKTVKKDLSKIIIPQNKMICQDTIKHNVTESRNKNTSSKVKTMKIHKRV
ncbi:uncharacterized protein LOC107265507 isoform X2 [Cephus cinctus]|nr:uncharacterized protein LOC107265507 isoform X2 [Cephus cinctus]